MKPITELPLDLIERHYRIEEDGAIFSLSKQRYLKATRSLSGAFYVYINISAESYSSWIAVHRLVASHYLGPSNGLEVAHIDFDKANNHYKNLEYLTRSKLLVKARSHKAKFTIPYTTTATISPNKVLLSNAKTKPVKCLFNNTETTYPSIEIAAKDIHSYRKDLYLSLTTKQPIRAKNSPYKGAIITHI